MMTLLRRDKNRLRRTISVSKAGVEWRVMEKCSCLRGKRVPNPPEMLQGTVLRGRREGFVGEEDFIYK